MSIDTAHFQEELELVRERLNRTIEHHDIGTASLEEETGELLSASADNHLADAATETYERELDEGLEEDAREQLHQVEKALARIESGEYGRCEICGKEIPGRAARGGSLDDALHRRREASRPVNEPARRESLPLDVRVGSSTNALRPILAAERPLGAGLRQWVSLAAIVVAAVAADQLTKQVVARALTLGEEVQIAGPFSIHHVRNSGIAFGFFGSATSIVIVVTAIAVAWMLVFFARSGGRHPVLPVALGLVLGGSIGNLLDRVRLGHVTDFLDFRFWPAFNLADVFIVVGVATLFGALAGGDRSKRRPPGTVVHSPLSRP